MPFASWSVSPTPSSFLRVPPLCVCFSVCSCAGRPLPLWLFVLRGNTALSRGWCMPLARSSAVCEQNAPHNTQIKNATEKLIWNSLIWQLNHFRMCINSLYLPSNSKNYKCANSALVLLFLPLARMSCLLRDRAPGMEAESTSGSKWRLFFFY